MDFSERLKALRKAKGLTQAQLAQKAGLSNGAVGNYESGKRNRISVESVCRLADALGVEPEELGLQRRFDLERRLQDSIHNHLQRKDSVNFDALIKAFSSLNAKGQSVAIERLQELAEIEKYKG